MKTLIFTLSLLVAASLPFSNLHSQIITETISYFDGDTELEGFLVYDVSNDGILPGIIVVHQWSGISDYEMKRAEMLAELGYVAFVADIYGKGVRPKTREESGATASIYRNDIPLFRSRVNAALNEIKKSDKTDNSNIAAIGYCFGGGAVLELARSGADLKGVVSFHGSLGTPNLEDAKNIKAKVLVLHGNIDPAVPKESIDNFFKEMENANVDYKFIGYAGAVHSFTKWDAGDNVASGNAYNETADRRSWIDMKVFFDEIFED